MIHELEMLILVIIKAPFIILTILQNEPLIQIELAHTLINIDNKKSIQNATKLLLKAKEPKSSVFIDEAMHNNLYDFEIEKNVIEFN